MAKREVSLETMAYREWLFEVLLTGPLGPAIKSLDGKYLTRGQNSGHVDVKLVYKQGASWACTK